MSGKRTGLLLGSLQIAIVLSLGAKLLYDRITRPRVWVLSEVYDPDLPIRGRYLSERLRVPSEGFVYKEGDKQNWWQNREWAYLELRDERLIATQRGSGPGAWVYLRKNPDGTVAAVTEEPALVFIPERAEVPSLKPGEEMWVEVTVPAKGPPRPIRIGVKKQGVLTPLKFN